MSRLSLRAHFFLQVLKKSRFGTLDVEFPDGKKEIFGEGLPVIRAQVKKWEVFDLLFTKGDLGLAETIIDGDLIVDDVAALVEWACKNDQALGQVVYGSWYGTFLDRLRHFLNRNTKWQAKKNIHAHYDLGNDFYKLWLDPTMTYSSAIFTDESRELKNAQLAKYDRIIDALEIRPGDRVLEIGCGWGGFFSRAVERTDCHVTAVTISAAQAAFDEQRISNLGMKKNVSLQKKDYRDIEGKYDKIVSIEMIEAVGEQYWGQYFGKVSESLKSKGSAMIQGITIREDLFYSYRKNTDFIQQYVFPGGMLLTNKVFDEQSKKNEMSLGSIFEFGNSYAETLKQWRENFQQKANEVRHLGFDDRFMRLWNLYLSYCEGAFRAGRINVGQFQIERI